MNKNSFILHLLMAKSACLLNNLHRGAHVDNREMFKLICEIKRLIKESKPGEIAYSKKNGAPVMVRVDIGPPRQIFLVKNKEEHQRRKA